MRRLFTILFILIFVGTGITFSHPKQGVKKPKPRKLFLIVGYNMLLPADKNFKDIYENQNFYPELKGGFFFTKKLYVWGSYGFFSSDGEIDVFGTIMPATSKQVFVGCGAGYCGVLSGKIDYLIEAGLVSFRYEEEALEKTESGSSYGFSFDLGTRYNFNRFFFTDFFAGYMYDSRTLARKIKLGGLTTGISLGFKF